MDDAKLKELVDLRTLLVGRYSKLKDYRQNKNAIMRELVHAELLHETIVKLDKILEGHVKFS
tara:strand:- start:1182 stop:1367 length:186 start_codon:yes stop_codon:yes gene_type:complete